MPRMIAVAMYSRSHVKKSDPAHVYLAVEVCVNLEANQLSVC
jgi:hypothetical protein